METRQTGWVLIITILILTLLGTLLSIFATGNEPPPIGVLLITPFILLVVLILFYQLVVEVNNETVKIRFGIGLIRKSWNIEKFESAKAVKNSFLHGWGIRFSGNTTIYNVSGLHAVELSLRNSKRKVRIGTNEPEKLAAHINRIIKNSAKG